MKHNRLINDWDLCITIITVCIFMILTSIIVFTNWSVVAPNDDEPEPVATMENKTQVDLGRYSYLTEPTVDSVISIQQWASQDLTEERYEYIKAKAEEKGIPYQLILSIIWTESSFRSQLLSDESSAAGYGQLTWAAAYDMYERLYHEEYTHDREEHRKIQTQNWMLNIDLTIEYLLWQYERYGYLETAVGAYHTGNDMLTNEFIDYIIKVDDSAQILYEYNKY